MKSVLDPEESIALASALYGKQVGKGLRSAELIRGKSSVADGASVYLLDDDVVMLMSPPAFPDAMADQATSMRAMTKRLGRDTSRPILQLRAEGSLRGCSYLAVPRCAPLSTARLRGRVDRWRARPMVLSWLRKVAALAEEHNTGAEERFSQSLEALCSTAGLSPAIASAAEDYRKQIRSGELKVGHVPMHGDLWHGNMMRKADGSLAIIDWGGSTPNGYGIYDLIRAGQSLGVAASAMKQEIAWHNGAINSGPNGAHVHLLAALGHYAARLGEFPREKFVALADDCVGTFMRFP